jgi:lysozyme family protein
MRTDEDILTAIIVNEGGYVDHASDKGGPTHWGITITTLAEHRMHPVTPDDVKALTVEEARAIYRKRYLAPFQGVTNPELRGLVVDCAVNHGVGKAAKMLQKAIGVDIDGDVGPATLETLEKQHWKHVYLMLCADRVRLYGAIITADHKQATFALGWARRVAEFIEAVA